MRNALLWIEIILEGILELNQSAEFKAATLLAPELPLLNMCVAQKEKQKSENRM